MSKLYAIVISIIIMVRMLCGCALTNDVVCSVNDVRDGVVYVITPDGEMYSFYGDAAMDDVLTITFNSCGEIVDAK